LPEEKDLLAAYLEADGTEGSVPGFVATLADIEPVISRFFDNVLVMDEDLALRQNRLALLQNIADLATGIADFSQLEGF
jgi:glycyl-tRNA synthetase beta subunit